MELYTGLIATALGLLAIFSRPGAAIGIVIFSTLIWPEYLRVGIGLAEMSVPRFIALILFLKLFMFSKQKLPKFNLVDLSVLAFWGWTIFAAFSSPEGPRASRMVGAGLDTVLMYAIARLALRREKDLEDLILPVALIAIIMCGFGVAESITHSSPFHQLEQYRNWVNLGDEAGERLGFLRARASTSVPIFFGLAMVLLSGLLWATKAHSNRKFLHLIAIAASVLGALTSLSSGPWIGCAILFACNAFEKRTNLIKPMMWLMLLAIIFVEVASNRHFYHLISYLGLSGGTAWYRTRLIEVMLSHIDEYWAIGIGGKSTDHWIDEIGGQASLDIVNHFLLLAYLSGVMAPILYLTAHIIAIKKAIKAYNSPSPKKYKRFIFCLASAIVALDITSLSVGIYGPSLIISNMMLGGLVSMSQLSKKFKAYDKNRKALESTPQTI